MIGNRISRYVIGLILIGFTLFPGYTVAHRLTVFGWVEGKTVFVQSKFSGGKKVNIGDVTILDADGNLLLSGKTDKNGEFSFAIPKKTDLKIIVDAGMGHRGEWLIPAAEIDDKEIAPIVQTSTSDTPKPEKSTFVSTDIEATMEKVLDRKLKPIIEMLLEQGNGASFKDIFGGIGYILGLVGLATYINFRRRKS